MAKRSILRFGQLHRYILEHNINQHTRRLRFRTFVYDDFDLGCERLQHFSTKRRMSLKSITKVEK